MEEWGYWRRNRIINDVGYILYIIDYIREGEEVCCTIEERGSAQMKRESGERGSRSGRDE